MTEIPLKPKEDWTDKLVMAGLFIFFAGAIVVIWQVGMFLSSGDWPSLSILSMWFFDDVEWATNPDSWLGLHFILSKTPLSAGLFGTGAIFIWVSAANS